MRQKSGTVGSGSEQMVRNIRRKTRRQYSAEEKIRIVLDGLRGEDSIVELCRREGLAQSIYYKWSKEFLEAGKKRLAGDTARAASEGDAASMYAFKGGIEGIGILSTAQLSNMGYMKPETLSRYNGGLVIQDQNGDGKLDPAVDIIVGGVLASAPAGAVGHELKSVEKNGKSLLSILTEKMAPKPGKRWGGSMLMLQFTGGSKPGKYRPTVALMKDPSNPSAGDGSSFTYTIEVE